MTQEEKDLLLKDLCGRLPYGTKVKCHFDSEPYTLLSINWNKEIVVIGFMMVDTYVTSKQRLVNIKPYLRPLSSMTEKERKEFLDSVTWEDDNGDFHIDECMGIGFYQEKYDWLNSHYFDYRGLIEKGLAIEVSEDYKPYKQRIEEL